jgi:spore coat polysaccharide biosynthesis protein SpsF
MKMASSLQTDFWRGEFGNRYTDRNNLDPALLRARVALWSEILSHTVAHPPASILEVGANIGVNLRALRALTGARFYALEPNEKARQILREDGVVEDGDVKDGIASAIGFADGAADLVFTSGVLIHIAPGDLEASMREIHRCSARYVVSVEYFSDKPTEVPYRGHADVLFKRDFGSTWLDQFPDLRVLGYGFAWKRVTGLDNLTWWLFEKR